MTLLSDTGTPPLTGGMGGHETESACAVTWRLGDALTERARDFGQLEALDSGKSAIVARPPTSPFDIAHRRQLIGTRHA
jgi:hypothetical protein